MFFFIDLKKHFFPFLLIGFISFFLYIAVYLVHHKQFDYDEYAAMHAAWSIKEGQLIYNDFADGHGPLAPVINSFIWKFFNLKDDVLTFFMFRYLSFIWMLIILFITYKIGQLLFDKKTAWLAILLLISNYVFVVKAIEIRPDLLQNVFWLSGLYFLLLKLKSNLNYSFLIGICWFFALMTNMKIVLPLAIAVFVFLLLYRGINKYRFLIQLFCIMFILYISYIIFLYFTGGLFAYIEHVLFLKMNTTLLIEYREFLRWHFVQFLKSSYMFLVLFLAGVVKNFKNNINGDIKFLTALLLILFFSIYLVGYFYQWYQVFLPLIAVLASQGLIWLMTISEKRKTNSNIILIIVFIFLLFNMFNSKHYNSITNTEKNNNQISEAEILLKITESADSCLYFRPKPTGAYVFRPHVFYNWNIPLALEHKMDSFNDLKLIKSDELIDRLKNGNCTIINVSDDKFKYFTKNTIKYINDNYFKIRDGLWLSSSLMNKYEEAFNEQ